MKRNLLVAVFLATAAVLGGCGRKGSGGGCDSLTAPSCGVSNTAQIENVEVSTPNGSVVVYGGQDNIPVFLTVVLDLPDSEFVSIATCLSTAKDILADGCKYVSSKPVDAWKRENPIKLRAGSAMGIIRPFTYSHVIVLVFRGHMPSSSDLRPGTPVSSLRNLLDYRVVEWEINYVPEP